MKKGCTVYFAHGKESGPWGTKIQALAGIARGKGCAVESPDYSTTQDPQKRVEMLLALKPAAGTLILVGSSMGGYVSAVASRTLKPRGLFLLAPAFYSKRYPVQSPRPAAAYTEIIHGWSDDVVPVANSVKYAGKYQVTLHIVDSDHRLTSAMDQIVDLFSMFLDRCLLKGKR
jgi:alpha/beta superfamily hydrolase